MRYRKISILLAMVLVFQSSAVVNAAEYTAGSTNVAFSENKDDFISHNVIRDLSRLVRKPNGKIEAGGTSIK